jgi:hypothetical protein
MLSSWHARVKAAMGLEIAAAKVAHLVVWQTDYNEVKTDSGGVTSRVNER